MRINLILVKPGDQALNSISAILKVSALISLNYIDFALKKFLNLFKFSEEVGLSQYAPLFS